MKPSHYLERAQAIEADLIRWRRDFHQHPELAFHEFRSAGIISAHLEPLGFQVETGVAETGVVAVLKGGRSSRSLVLRFDMDALPVEEVADHSYASVVPGVMHACGHDGHMAIGMGVARLLAEGSNELPGTVALVFQPAEEGQGGAERMLETGFLERLKPDTALALHLWNDLPVGSMGVTAGPVMAGADRFVCTVHGRGGHAAMPHMSTNPVPAAAALVQVLQAIPSQESDPREPFVLTVTRLHGGKAFNVIPDSVELEGTLRYFSHELRQQVITRMHEAVEATAGAFGCRGELDVQAVAVPVVNDPEVTGRIQSFIDQQLPSCQCRTDFLLMVSEDMAYFLARVPGCYLFVGSGNEERGLTAAHHNPSFDFDERALVNGTGWLAAITQRLLEVE
ncbi:MAG: M20 family metallopeptidase [Anaerolineales bacterium]